MYGLCVCRLSGRGPHGLAAAAMRARYTRSARATHGFPYVSFIGASVRSRHRRVHAEYQAEQPRCVLTGSRDCVCRVIRAFRVSCCSQEMTTLHGVCVNPACMSDCHGVPMCSNPACQNGPARHSCLDRSCASCREHDGQKGASGWRPLSESMNDFLGLPGELRSSYESRARVRYHAPGLPRCSLVAVSSVSCPLRGSVECLIE